MTINGTHYGKRPERLVILERLARAICARHNGCDPACGYVDIHYEKFLPAAHASLEEFERIEMERKNGGVKAPC